MRTDMVPTERSSPNHRRQARKATILKGLLTAVVSVVIFTGLTPAPAHAAGPRIWIDRTNGRFAVQGINFRNGSSGTVHATLGSQSASRSVTARNKTGKPGYFWTELSALSKGCGNATASVTVAGATAKATKSIPCSSGGSSTPTTNPPSTTNSGNTGGSSNPSGWKLVTQDDFNYGSKTDLKNNWEIYNGAGNAGIGYRRDSAISVGDGQLRITGDGDVSGGLRLKDSRTYGRWEVRAKLSSGSGFNTATLLWPTSGRWPVDGEIDITEVSGSNHSQTGSFVHYGSDNKQKQFFSDLNDPTGWHTFAVEWERDHITFFLDGKVMHSKWGGAEAKVTDGAAIPDNPHFLAIQLDVSSKGPHNKTTYDVDWVKVYSR